MTTYRAQEGVFVGRPPCAECGANYHLHHDGVCPAAWRPTTPAEAERELAAAEASGDPTRVFVARGDVQRVHGRPAGTPVNVPADPPSPLTVRVAGHEAMPEGKTLSDWSFRAHCKADREPWPCRTVLLATLDAARAPDAGLRARIEALPLFDPDVTTMADAAESMRRRAAALATAPAPGGLDETLLRKAVEYGYQRGDADRRYLRGYRPTLAVANFVQEQIDAATLRAATRPAEEGEK